MLNFKVMLWFSSTILILFSYHRICLVTITALNLNTRWNSMSGAKSASNSSSQSEGFGDIFKEYRNDINLFLTKYNDYFEASCVQEAEIIERTAKMNQSLISYKSDLAKKLNDYNEKLVEFQVFIDNLIKKK